VGRLPVLAMLNDLDEAALIQILTEPKNALIKQYQQLFAMENVRLTFAQEALIDVAKQAITRKTGARGLRAILENILLDTMFDLPGQKNLEEVVINPQTVTAGAEPLKIFTDVEGSTTKMKDRPAEDKRTKKAS
jgi:ATP-dependent Clp protease ATP-binding subunit ClpX